VAAVLQILGRHLRRSPRNSRQSEQVRDKGSIVCVCVGGGMMKVHAHVFITNFM
jgi:hypothetical protein